MAAIQDDLDGLAGARDLPSLLEQVQAAVRLRRRPPPHLAGHRAAVARRADDPAHLRPLRVAAGQGLHGRGVHRRRASPRASRSPSTCRPTGRSRTPSTRSSGCTSSTSAPAGRTRSSARRTCSSPDAIDDARGAARGASPLHARLPPAAALARHREASASPPAPDRASDRTFNENLAKLPELGCVFELQVFPNQLASALRAGGGAPRPDVRADPRRDADRGRAVARRAHASCAHHPNVTSSSPARARSSTASTPS